MPRVIAEEWLPKLGEAELKVYLYIAHRTVDFNKEWDAVSIPQIMNGVRNRAGKMLDVGTGLSERAARAAIQSLRKLKLLEVRYSDGKCNLYAVRCYRVDTVEAGSSGPRLVRQSKAVAG